MLEIFAKLNVGNNDLELIIDNSQVFNLLLIRPEERKNNCVSFDQCVPDKRISGEYEFRIVVHDESELFGFTTIPVDDGRFTEDFLTFGQSYYLKKDGEENWRRLPTLHLSVLNMLSEDIYRYIPTFPRYASIMDNSIWNYYYSLQKGNDDVNHEMFKKILSEIAINSSKNLYRLSNSLEYANHNSRLIRESYISAPKGHGLNVSPFLFHSETKRYDEVKGEYIKKGESLLLEKGHSFTHKWRILLLDDHALRLMNYVVSTDKNGAEGILEDKIKAKKNEKQEIPRKDYVDIIPDKLRIISNDIRSVFSDCNIGYVRADDDYKTIYDELTNESVDESYDIVFYCVSSVDNAQRALENRRFEIVLLDYLLGKKADGTREYSYELLNNIYKEDKKNPIFGPHDRLYFSFISAFTTAVNERLLAEGWHKSEKFWHIADGACPTNTPYLFLYNLLHLMNKRVVDMGVPMLSNISRQGFEEVKELDDEISEMEKRLKENPNDSELNDKLEARKKSKVVKDPYVKKIIDDIYNDSKTVRKMANEKFDDVLSLLYHYKKLLEDTHNTQNVFESKRSVLATEFIKKNPSLGGFLEHLTQLVYLTAFGTVRQWPEMWEEYQYISSIVGPQQNIEKYIMELKSNNI